MTEFTELTKQETRRNIKQAKNPKEYAEAMMAFFREQPYYKIRKAIKEIPKAPFFN